MSGLLRSRTSTSKNSPEATSRFPTPSSPDRAARAGFAPVRLEPALAPLRDQVSGLQNATFPLAALRQAELPRTPPAQESTRPRQTRLRHPQVARPSTSAKPDQRAPPILRQRRRRRW